VLDIRLIDEYVCLCVLCSDGILQKDVLMLNFFPQLEESEFGNNNEYIFVIDRSGVYSCLIPLSPNTSVTLSYAVM